MRSCGKIGAPVAPSTGGEVIKDMTKEIDINQILKILPHRYPFLLVDRILEYEPKKRAVAIKNVTMNEPQFQGHFPGIPIMPGVLLLESMAQVGAVLFLQEPEAAGRRRTHQPAPHAQARARPRQGPARVVQRHGQRHRQAAGQATLRA